MEIVYDENVLERFINEALLASVNQPILIDKFLDDAVEVDVDLIGDGQTYVIGGILEHIEEAGVHSGDSAMCLPAFTLGKEIIDKVRESTYALAKELKVKGLMNVQYAIKDENLYVLEVKSHFRNSEVGIFEEYRAALSLSPCLVEVEAIRVPEFRRFKINVLRFIFKKKPPGIVKISAHYL